MAAIDTLLQVIRPDLTAYFAKVDARLAGCSAGTQCEMLLGEIRRQERRYGEFIAKVDGGLPTSPGVTAFDYIETLAGLEQRLTRAEAANRERKRETRVTR